MNTKNKVFDYRCKIMTIEQLDNIFPFTVFLISGYLILVNYLTNKFYSKQYMSSFSSLHEKQIFFIVLFVLSGFWSLQNIWFS
jgi:hypothetical protein